ncbi:pyruvate kinase [Sedimenticola selenatireducens]|uniref:Pyruvate kinase n=1 Tax=Sedimenticola selenatireducens TaxID=191960 RepID=A0A557SKI3_9GAMM|nr:pyruvate kinase [Sedimenticola selenatireducens]TVO77832.1 pyruvate kinase [Sedimenticola selenatireducens]TVT65137.1 MAG: pyruvate kinase [Sedimenticola selenatireducens]
MGIKTELDLLHSRRTKIVATLGPSSNDAAIIRQLIESGVNVFRMNMSHGSHEDHEATYEKVRSIANELNNPIAIFADLCGPKIRTGLFKNGQITLTTDSTITVTTRDITGEAHLIPSQYSALADDVNPGDRILLDDGKLELLVCSIDDTEITCKVTQGGTLKDKKGINLPGVAVSAPSLTQKDKQDAQFALNLGVDFLALSFVRTEADVLQLRKLIDDGGFQSGIISKFEKPEALINASSIIKVSDAIMVARGDLGVELKPEQVPVAQRKLINRARNLNRPVIVATQMLESMMENTHPSRAEVSDISQAVAEGVDAVMLSGETAAGSYPVQTVRMMARIIQQTEAYLFEENNFADLERHLSQMDTPIPFGHAIAHSTANMAKQMEAKVIISLSNSGMSAVTISSARPTVPLLAISCNPGTYRRFNLQWGTLPILAEDAGNTHPNKLARRVARDSGAAQEGDFIVLVRGFASNPKLNTPSITLLTV